MIYLYSGTPGSGKSLHAVYDLYTRLRLGRNCIANFPINFDCQMGHKLRKDKFLYLPKEKITVKALLKESLRVTHKRGFHENNILFVVDEAELLWNSRMFQQRERMDWISFFSQHRHFGFNIILIAQKDRMIDRQIRALIEYDVEHRKANNFKLFKLIPFPVFICIERWYSINEKIESSPIFYNRQKAKLYNSYASFGQYDEIIRELLEEAEREEAEEKRRKEGRFPDPVGTVGEPIKEQEVKQDEQKVHGGSPGSRIKTIDRVCDVERQADGEEKEGDSGKVGPGTQADYGEDGSLEMGA